MPTPFFQLLGHVELVVQTSQHNPEAKSALQANGFGGDKLAEGHEMIELGETLPDRRNEEAEEDKIMEHGVHSSATEVEMWMQTAAFRVKKAVDDQALVDKVTGSDIHADDHVIEVVARAFRMMGMIRTNGVIHEKLGKGRSVKDLLIRGNTLLRKLLGNGDKLMSPGHVGDATAPVFEDIKKLRRQMTIWVQDLDVAADQMSDQAELLGELGYVPDDVGLPLGGTGYSITLHERSQREPPDPDEEPKGDPGWTIGRQGRNDENMGKGWVDPSFD